MWSSPLTGLWDPLAVRTLGLSPHDVHGRLNSARVWYDIAVSKASSNGESDDAGSSDPTRGAGAYGGAEVATLIPMVRRIVHARVGSHPAADDLVQETLTRVLAASSTIEPGMLEPYAIVTARNVVASMWRDNDRKRRNQHRVVDLSTPDPPDTQVMLDEEQSAMSTALARLSDRERRTLLDHEVSGTDTRTLAAREGSTAGAVAARLNRTRARLRVEYVLALERVEPPTDRCRPVLIALSSGDQRRQREVRAAQHVLECETCARLSQPLLERGQQREDSLRIPIAADPDIVAARGAVARAGGASAFRARRTSPSSRPRSPRCAATSCGSRAPARSSSSCWTNLDAASRSWPVTAVRASPTWTVPSTTASARTAGWAWVCRGCAGSWTSSRSRARRGHGTTVTMTKWERTNDE